MHFNCRVSVFVDSAPCGEGPPNRSSRFWRRSGSLLLLASLAVAPGCGGLDSGLTLAQQPHWRPSAYFTGQKTGHRTVFDRNGNIREVVRIERSCESVAPEQKGTCRDRLDYGYATPDTEDTTRWSIHYLTDLKSRVSYEDGYGALEGETFGSMMVLNGDRLLPGAPPKDLDAGDESDDASDSKAATVEIRMHLRPGAGHPMMQSEQYTYLGIEIGRTETLWLDR